MREAFWEFSPFQWKSQLKTIESFFTPEEHETVVKAIAVSVFNSLGLEETVCLVQHDFYFRICWVHILAKNFPP